MQDNGEKLEFPLCDKSFSSSLKERFLVKVIMGITMTGPGAKPEIVWLAVQGQRVGIEFGLLTYRLISVLWSFDEYRRVKIQPE